MYTHISFETNATDLRKEVWEFMLIDVDLYLDKYTIQTRESTRKRNWNVESAYFRLSGDARNWRGKGIVMDDVPLTVDIKKKALDILMSRITVKVWDKN